MRVVILPLGWVVVTTFSKGDTIVIELDVPNSDNSLLSQTLPECLVCLGIA